MSCSPEPLATLKRIDCVVVSIIAVMISSPWTSLQNWGRQLWALAFPTGGTVPFAVGLINKYISDIAFALVLLAKCVHVSRFSP